jgi:hypothetical protein
MDYMSLFSGLLLALTVGTLPTGFLGAFCMSQGWFHNVRLQDRYTLILTAWALFTLIIFTAMNHQGTFWK